MEYLQLHYKEWGITSLAVPPLGCGNGQLEWRIVGPTLYRYLSQLDIPVELYAPYGTPKKELRRDFLGNSFDTQLAEKTPTLALRIEPAWVAIVEILRRIEQEPYHWPVGRTTFQKIVFVATHEGLPTKLRFSRGSNAADRLSKKAKSPTRSETSLPWVGSQLKRVMICRLQKRCGYKRYE